MSETKRYFAHGKLLITGEYAVLDGALALAIPCKLGQWLEVETTQGQQTLVWESLDEKGKSWFSGEFDVNLNILQTTDERIAQKLQEILKLAITKSSSPHVKLVGTKVTTKLEFNKNWGLGSSSTLIHLISQWTDSNPYQLLEKSFGGSGYDIACASAKQPILYKTSNPPSVQEINFDPKWADNMHFIYLGNKQVSRKEIQKYATLQFDRKKLASKISKLTLQVTESKNQEEFATLLEAHEKLLSETLGYPTIKSQRFPNMDGTFKSLGAWGGDFVLFVGNPSELEKIKQLGYNTILEWREMLIPLG
jgi:mevalonate kinase